MPAPLIVPPRPAVSPPRMESRIGSGAGTRPARSSNSASCRSTRARRRSTRHSPPRPFPPVQVEVALPLVVTTEAHAEDDVVHLLRTDRRTDLLACERGL